MTALFVTRPRRTSVVTIPSSRARAISSNSCRDIAGRADGHRVSTCTPRTASRKASEASKRTPCHESALCAVDTDAVAVKTVTVATRCELPSCFQRASSSDSASASDSDVTVESWVSGSWKLTPAASCCLLARMLVLEVCAFLFEPVVARGVSFVGAASWSPTGSGRTIIRTLLQSLNTFQRRCRTSNGR
eukprot:scaffold952_cov409-Prasinococcus_capsulatus_cf.AAC.16